MNWFGNWTLKPPAASPFDSRRQRNSRETGQRHKRSDSGPLRRQPPDGPSSVFLCRVKEAVMQAVDPSLPEFDLARDHPETAPPRGQGNLALGELSLHFRPLHFQKLARGDDRALPRNPGSDLAAARPRDEI